MLKLNNILSICLLFWLVLTLNYQFNATVNSNNKIIVCDNFGYTYDNYLYFNSNNSELDSNSLIKLKNLNNFLNDSNEKVIKINLKYYYHKCINLVKFNNHFHFLGNKKLVKLKKDNLYKF